MLAATAFLLDLVVAAFVLAFVLTAFVLTAFVLAAFVLTACAVLREELRDPLLSRVAGAEVRALTLGVRGFVRVAAAKDVTDSSKAEASKSVVFIVFNENIEKSLRGDVTISVADQDTTVEPVPENPSTSDNALVAPPARRRIEVSMHGGVAGISTGYYGRVPPKKLFVASRPCPA